MSFKLGDIIIDRIQMGYAETLSGTPLYTLSQLADSTIEISADSKDATDKDGTLVKRFWKGKTGTYTANNAMVNVNVIGAAAGSGVEQASVETPSVMPKIMTVAKGTKDLVLEDAVEGSIQVSEYCANGTMGKTYTQAASASATAFGYVTDGNKFTAPTDTDVELYVVKYDRKVTSGIVIKNKADKFPKTVKLTLKALCVDPCTQDTLRACYIVLPSFQVSPEISLELTTESQIEYKGDLQVNYCSTDKSLYEFYMAEDDVEEDE